MKTYTIKPLEWIVKGEIWIASDSTIISRVDYVDGASEFTMNYKQENKWLDFTTKEEAKAKAQELHEAELMKYLQEVAE